MNTSKLLLWLLCGVAACQSPQAPNENHFTWDDRLPPESSEFLGPAVISTREYVRDFSLSPGGDEAFFTVANRRGDLSVIMQIHKVTEGQWSLPEIASFSGRYRDLEASFHPDGKQVFFASNRPLSPTDSSSDVNIWQVKKEGGGWGEARPFSEVINGPGDEFFPSVASSGNLYFTASPDFANRKEDIFLSKWDGAKYLPPMPLGEGINSPGYEFNAFVAPDESWILFTAFGRKDGPGRGDIMISFRKQDDWEKASLLPEPINSPFLDYCPSVQNNTLFFTSERHGFKSAYPDGLQTEQWQAILASPLNGTANIYWQSWHPEKWLGSKNAN
ncbi:MAG: hypothetical protein AAF206_08735 [Bacteroidota bacterium]